MSHEPLTSTAAIRYVCECGSWECRQGPIVDRYPDRAAAERNLKHYSAGAVLVDTEAICFPANPRRSS